MCRAMIAVMVAACSLGMVTGARAASVAFIHERSIYADGKGSGLARPEGVACSKSGTLVVADTGNHRLVTYTYKEQGGLSGGEQLKLDTVTSPTRLQLDSKGNIWVLDRKTQQIVRLSPEGALFGVYEIKGAPATTGKSSGKVVPSSFKLDAADNVYVLDVGTNRVVIANSEGAFQRQIDLPSPGGVIMDIDVDAKGTLYAVDGVSATVYSVAKGATSFSVLTQSLKGNIGFPVYLTTSATGGGMIFLVDQHGSGIAQVSPDGTYMGRQLSMGWVDGLLYYPAQMCFNGNGLAFIADRNNNRVQAFSAGK